MKRNRYDILIDLISYNRDIKFLNIELKDFPFDSSFPIVKLSKDKFISVLEMYISGSIDAEDLEDWADAIECRDDIGFSDDIEVTIKNFIHEISNPSLFGEINIGKISKILLKIE